MVKAPSHFYLPVGPIRLGCSDWKSRSFFLSEIRVMNNNMIYNCFRFNRFIKPARQNIMYVLSRGNWFRAEFKNKKAGEIFSPARVLLAIESF